MTSAGAAPARPGAPVVVETAPLSPGQQRLIADEFALPGGQWPEVGAPTRMRPIDTAAILIDGRLNTDALRSAIGVLAARQSALRTTFRRLADGTPVQLVIRTDGIPLTRSDLPLDPAADVTAELLLRHAPAAVVDPRRDSLFRTHLITTGPGRHVLLLQIHHLISDGWSIGVLYRDLSELYHAAVNGDPPRLPVLPTSFASFCRQMHHERGSDTNQQQLRYWRDRLCPPLAALPRPATAPAVAADLDTNPVAVTSVAVDAATVASLLHTGHHSEHRGGIAGPFLAALALVLHHHTGGTDVRIGMMISNRGRPNTEHLIGYFVNTAVIRLAVTEHTEIARLTNQATIAVIEAIEHQELPIQDLRDTLHDAGELIQSPLYQVTLALNTMRTGTLELPGLTCRDIDVEEHRARIAPTRVEQRWVLEARDGALTGTLTYRTDIPGAIDVLADISPAMTAVAIGRGTVAGVSARLRSPSRRPSPAGDGAH